ncbi:eukaryotic translation initiation factor 4E [Coemansia nantahalensis]|uniref:Eukaryotic translation initiation factor 4E n=1 Tax=Coemansia nantahalensis TaxID=2789366 RepID=A0ACC1JLF4_9FUNG|nr:eukaryotic translation initiation factor 4E [Coemansia nantahalensis]KAJ2769336.1 eukaryotic translation initiation factor 4E [Coemansia nantahalensis]
MTEVAEAGSAPPIKTVLDDPKDYNAVHKLNSEWTLWFDNQSGKASAATWTDNLKPIVTIGTVEEFWGVYNTVAIATDLPNRSNLHLFRKGIKPMWEDSANSEGGKWGILLQRSIGEKANEHWLHTLLACIGETFEASSDVCGVVFSNRKNCFRIAIWTRNAANRDACESIGRHLKKVLGISFPLEYLLHKDTAGSGSKSNTSGIYSV